MADLTSSAVTVLDSWTEGSVTGKRNRVLKVRLTLSGQGTAAAGERVTATALGLSVIHESSMFSSSTSESVYGSAPTHDGSVLLFVSTDEDVLALSGVVVQGIVKGE